jgi:predicted nucleotide-binding protein
MSQKGHSGTCPVRGGCDAAAVPLHIRITLVERSWTDELALDLTREQLEQRFLAPRREGRPITLNGRTFSWEAIERIHINETAETSTELLPAIRAERAALPGIVLGIPDEWYVTDRGQDVTDALITEPVGAAAPPTAAVLGDGILFHVRGSSGLLRQAEEFNLTERELIDRFVDPWRAGEQVIIGGKGFAASGGRLTIYAGPRLTTSQRSMGQGWLSATRYGENVSDEFLTQHRRTTSAPAHDETTAPLDPRQVAVAYGRDPQAVEALFDFLKDLGLRPLRWEQLRALTGKTSPYTGEIVDTAFAVAQAVVVLFTPDDEARLNPELHGKREPEHEREFTGQPRQNVLIEAGMALKTHADRTIIVEIGQLRPISNLAGMNTVRIGDGSVADRLNEIISRLETADCPVDRNGGWTARISRFQELAAHERRPSQASAVAIDSTEPIELADDLVLEIRAAANRAGIELTPPRDQALADVLRTAEQALSSAELAEAIPAPKLLITEVRALVSQLKQAKVIRPGPESRGWVLRQR